eukprot:813028-Rhodomonas_salina.1
MPRAAHNCSPRLRVRVPLAAFASGSSCRRLSWTWQAAHLMSVLSSRNIPQNTRRVRVRPVYSSTAARRHNQSQSQSVGGAPIRVGLFALAGVGSPRSTATAKKKKKTQWAAWDCIFVGAAGGRHDMPACGYPGIGIPSRVLLGYHDFICDSTTTSTSGNRQTPAGLLGNINVPVSVFLQPRSAVGMLGVSTCQN